MSDTFSKVEVITGVARRRRFSTDLKLAVVAETMQPGMSVSYVARRHGLSSTIGWRTTTPCILTPSWAIAHPASTSFPNPLRVRFDRVNSKLPNEVRTLP